MKPQLELCAPHSGAEWEQYFELRYRVLRAPWGQPRGSERDEREDSSFHLLARTTDDAVIGVGRLHFNSPTQAQIRYMAVAPAYQHQGIGQSILAALEQHARQRGATHIVLHARAGVVEFYAQHGYHTVTPSHILFGVLPHYLMEKTLSPDPSAADRHVKSQTA